MTRQGFACLGLTAMIAMSRLDYRILGPLSLTMYLLARWAGVRTRRRLERVRVAAMDPPSAARRQPSELAKVCTVIMLAKYLSDHEEQVQIARVPDVAVDSRGPRRPVLVEPDLGLGRV
jgi:cell division protein FtsW (lipid II flippase)